MGKQRFILLSLCSTFSDFFFLFWLKENRIFIFNFPLEIDPKALAGKCSTTEHAFDASHAAWTFLRCSITLLTSAAQRLTAKPSSSGSDAAEAVGQLSPPPPCSAPAALAEPRWRPSWNTSLCCVWSLTSASTGFHRGPRTAATGTEPGLRPPGGRVCPWAARSGPCRCLRAVSCLPCHLGCQRLSPLFCFAETVILFYFLAAFMHHSTWPPHPPWDIVCSSSAASIHPAPSVTLPATFGL